MNELYVLRHGIAVDPGSSGLPDDARQLTQKGINRMRQIAAGLATLDLELDAIVTSPLMPRADRRPRSSLMPLASEAGSKRRTCCRRALTRQRSNDGSASEPRPD